MEFRVQGPDKDKVRAIADQVKNVMRAHPKTVGVNDNWANKVKVLRIEVDQDKARAVGISSQSVARAAQTILTWLDNIHVVWFSLAKISTRNISRFC